MAKPKKRRQASLTEGEALAEAEAVIQALVNEGLCRPDEADGVLDTKRDAEATKAELGDLLTGHKRSLKGRPRHRPQPTIPDYHGLEGRWASYLEAAQTYESKVPTQDRDDWRHNCMLELERAERRDGKPLPLLRAYRIASLTVALYYRELNRFNTRVCVFNGYATSLNCKGCPNKSEGKRCVWLAVRPVESLDREILDAEGYRVRLLDTIATERLEDMPDKWCELNEIRQGLPLRLVEIGYKRLHKIPLDKKDQKYLERYLKKAQISLF